MLKRLVLAAGTLLAANFIADAPASASIHRGFHAHRSIAARAAPGRFHRRFALRRASGRLAVYRGARYHDGRLTRRRGFALARRVHGLRYAHRFVRRATRLVRASQDTLIRNEVGPTSAYTPASTPVGAGVQTGAASYYSGGRTASGGIVGAATCAHRSLPFGTRVLVTNLATGNRMVLTVNDRGPFVHGRILDVSRTAAGALGMLRSGTARIAMQVVGGRG